MDKKLKVMVFTQQDRFFIPANILKAAKVCNIIEIVNNQSKHSFDNKMSDLIAWFGFWQCAKMGIRSITRVLQGALDAITGFKLFGGVCSIKHAAHKLGCDYRVVTNINHPDFVQHVRDIAPDLVISYSAPQVIKEELLNVPRNGIINVHGALLPHYRGAFPSFWYLFNNEKSAGATVHLMSTAIDDGDICLQAPIDISDCNTMLEVMAKTKQLGGELICQTIKLIEEGKLTPKPNNVDEGSYFSWPTREQGKQFRKMGKKLC